jgi:chemotaxis protein MotB
MRRPRKQPEEANELRWLTTYSDVVTLLMAFFVMLYAISQVDQQKFELFVSGLADPFGNPAVAEGLLNSGSGFVGADQGDGQGNLDPLASDVNPLAGVALLDGLPEIADYPEKADPNEEVQPEEQGAAEAAMVTTDEELLRVREAIVSALSAAGLDGVVEFEPDERGLVIAIATDHVLFASGSAEFGADGERIIQVLAPTLAEFSNQILVEGHTDTVPLDRDGYDNWNLSTDRALAVLKVLAGYPGIDSERLVATGYGEYHPRASNETDEGKAANRRVELVIVVERG